MGAKEGLGNRHRFYAKAWTVTSPTTGEGVIAAMEKLKEAFEKAYKFPLTEIINLPDNLVPLYPERGEDNYFFYSQIAEENQFPTYRAQGEIESFLELAPQGYFQVGFWGHGVNSYAFYYARVDNWSKIFFRLPYGGVYMDNEIEGEQGRKFLTNYFQFEERIMGKAKVITAVDSMGEGYYRVSVSENKEIEVKESIYHDGDFNRHFKEII